MPRIVSPLLRLRSKTEMMKNVVEKLDNIGCGELFHYLMSKFKAIKIGYNSVFEKSFDEMNGFYYLVEMDINEIVKLKFTVENAFQSDSIVKMGARFVIYKDSKDVKKISDSYLYVKSDNIKSVIDYINAVCNINSPSPYTPLMELYDNKTNQKTLIFKETDYEETNH